MDTLLHNRDGLQAVAQKFNERSWLKQGTWPGSFLWFSAILDSFSEEWTGRVLDRGLAIRDYACIGQPHGAYDCLIGASCFGEVRAVMERAYTEEGPTYFRKYAELCETKFEDWLRFAEQIAERGDSLKKLPNGELYDLLLAYFVHMRENGAFMDTIIVLGDLLGDVVGGQIDRVLRTAGIDDPAAYGVFLEVHSEPPLPTNLARSQQSLRELAAKVQKSPALRSLFEGDPAEVVRGLEHQHPDMYAAILEHRNRFGWLNTYSFLGRPHSSEEIIQFVQENLDALEQAGEEQAQAAEQNPLVTQIQNLTIPAELRELLGVIRLLAYVNAAKDDAHQITWQKVQTLMSVIAERVHCELEELTRCTVEELMDALDGDPLEREHITARAESWVLLKIGNALHIVEGQRNVDVLRQQLKSILPADTPRVTGKGVFDGRVRGRARIVLTSADCSRVNSGDILIATNTSPDFVPAMRRAAAFVTDTGNLICHAVIAAREFKKPCVISTQIATQVLRDGEWLEVDGSTGLVTRLDVVEHAASAAQ